MTLNSLLESRDCDSRNVSSSELVLVSHDSSARRASVNTRRAYLKYSRIQAGRMQAQFEPADLSSVTAELASVFRSAIDRAGLVFTVDCPPLDEPVYLDREMWEKIFLNLLSNAFKSTFEGEIAVLLKEADGGAQLTVSDTGTGIPQNEIPHLFERFRRIEGARRRTNAGHPCACR